MRNDTVLDLDGYARLEQPRKEALHDFVDQAFGEGIRHTDCYRLQLSEAGCTGWFYARRDDKILVEDGEPVTFTATTTAVPPNWRLTPR